MKSVTVRSQRGDKAKTRSIIISSDMSIFDMIVIMDEMKGLDEFAYLYEKHPNEVIELLCRFAKGLNKHFTFDVELPPKTDEARNFHESTWTSSVIHCQLPMWFERLFSVSPWLEERLMLDGECKRLFEGHWFRAEIG